MKRKCTKIISTNDNSRAIYIDDANKDEILKYLNQDPRHSKKFRFITDLILGGHKNTDIYDKEDINKKCKDVTAMKLFKGQENDRLYCKEIRSSEGTFVVIVAVLYQHKKSQKLTQEQKNIINKVGSFIYEI